MFAAPSPVKFTLSLSIGLIRRQTHQNSPVRSRAFTLVELLVVIAIIGTLVGLLLPAVQSAREAGRRTACGNNVRQIALASAQHESQRRYFPSGGWGWWWAGDPDRGFGKTQPGSWIYSLLPNIEQANIYSLGSDGEPDVITETQKTGAAAALAIPIPIFICPTRRSSQAYPSTAGSEGLSANSSAFTKTSKSDYAANAGSLCIQWGQGPPDMPTALSGAFANMSASNGVSHQRSEIKPSMITDGLSKTYLLGEKYLDPNKYLNANSFRDDQGMLHGDDFDVHGWTAVRPLSDTRGFDGWIEFGSAHPTGFWMAFADGSVRTVAFSVDSNVHALAGSRSDGQVVESP